MDATATPSSPGAPARRSTGPRDENRVQPLTTTFRLGGVDVARTSSKELHRLLAEAPRATTCRGARARRTARAPRRRAHEPTRVSGVDATDPWQLSAAEQEGRRQVQEYVRFLRDRVPGYEEAYLLGTSVWIGVRETRRLHGRYVLTRDDVLSARDFDSPDDPHSSPGGAGHRPRGGAPARRAGADVAIT